MTEQSRSFVQGAKRTLGLSDRRMGLIVGAPDNTVRRWQMPPDASGHREPSEAVHRILAAAVERVERSGGVYLAVYPDRIEVLEVTTEHAASSYGQPVLVDMAGLTDVATIAGNGGIIEAENPERITRGLPPGPLRDAVKPFRRKG